jgi:RHS repeat-associated protein
VDAGGADAGGSVSATAYWHEDLIGSTTLTTDETGGAGILPADLSYSAFGELLTASGAPGGFPPAGAPRYQYAGAWGYESGLLSLQGANPALPPITLQHLGHRWYQPDVGRFVQRDPIGIRGGLDVCEYVHSNPIAFIDPLGLQVQGFPPPGRIPIRDIIKVATTAVTAETLGATTISAACTYVGFAAGVGAAAGVWLVGSTPIEDWVGAGLAPIVGPGAGPGIPEPPPPPWPGWPQPRLYRPPWR